ncbi:MAG: methionine synthase [Jatrophihabitans sp.]
MTDEVRQPWPARADQPWPPGAATGIGSLPGADPNEALRLVLDELPDLPHLPELPNRGPGADMIGRTAALLTELPVEIQPSGWRFTAHPGRDQRRARDFLAYDLDALAVEAQGYDGAFKVQCVGPLTLAAGIELPSGHRAVSDHGAVADIAASLAEGLAEHLGKVRAVLPAARVVVQLDEPSVPGVIGGRVPTASGYGTIRSVADTVVEQRLTDVLAVVPAGFRVVHCCAADAPLELFRRAGADAVAVDLDQIGNLDVLGELIDVGVDLWLGAVPTSGETDEPADALYRRASERIVTLWRTLGFPDADLPRRVVPTPACGLAGASEVYARTAMRAVRDTAQALTDL